MDGRVRTVDYSGHERIWAADPVSVTHRRKASTLLRSVSRGDAMPLICFPPAGAGTSFFRRWATRIGPAVVVWAVQLPGREARMNEPAITDMAALVELLVEDVLPALPSRYAFVGHSMGALLAFEFACRLTELGHAPPVHMFVAACSSPSWRTSASELHRLSDPELLAYLRELNGTPRELLENDELMALVLPTLRADLTATETYVHAPGRRVTAGVSALHGRNDVSVSREAMLAWREVVNGTFSYHEFRGDHFFVLQDEADVLDVICATVRER